MPITLDSGTRHFMSMLSNLTNMFIYSIDFNTGYDFYRNYSAAIWQFIEDFSYCIPTTCIIVDRSSNHLIQTPSVQPNPEGILETYTVGITAFKNTEKAPALLPYVSSSSSSINIKEHLLEEWIAHELCKMKALRWAREETSCLLIAQHSFANAWCSVTFKGSGILQGCAPLLVAIIATMPIIFKSMESPKRSRPRPHPCRRAGPKTVIGDDHSELSTHPPPKPRPLAQSKCSGPMTSSAEEEIFEASFSRHSSIIQKTSDIAIDQQPCLSDVQLADGTSLTCAEFCLLADQQVSADIQEGDVESGKHFIMLLHPLLENTPLLNDNDQGTSATCTESHNARYSNEDHGKDASGTSTELHYPEDGRNDDGHKTLGMS
ncbi:hypothetical protein BDR06DRAFT_975569 [Suillus hirtellus]|nr:hypothetical protein BDR06DRAFT_975569 [Suillus hirtellus]